MRSRVLKLLEEPRDIDSAFQRALRSAEPGASSDSAQTHKKEPSAVTVTQSSSSSPELEFVVVSAHCLSRDGSDHCHRCFVALRSRTVRWRPRDDFTNEVVPLDCSPIPDTAVQALWDAAERLELAATEDAPAWMLCGAQGYST
mmetsp:Transcript_38314/g.80281  ORF Transcript_38314/g.80281 Transcript_38314/m.80281 type:complete len:144 (-) Transcript_38314:158-589(-)